MSARPLKIEIGMVAFCPKCKEPLLIMVTVRRKTHNLTRACKCTILEGNQ